MKKIICLFPGQGSQYVGMGKLFNDKLSKEIFECANDTLGFDLKKLMVDGPEDELKKTEFTQPAILTHSYLITEKLRPLLDQKNLKISCVLGHSVGEYSALVAADSISFTDAIKSVNQRGKFMQEAVGLGEGAMLAVLKVPLEIIEKACKSVSNEGSLVMPANINSSGQIVVSGHSDACERLQSWFNENHQSSYRIVPLKVSAPFHSSLMKPAEKNLESFFDQINFKENKISYIDNLTASINDIGTSGETIKEKLIGQVSGAVQWEKSILSLATEETSFLEVGPGKTLMGICRSIDRQYKVTPLDIENLDEKLLEIL